MAFPSVAGRLIARVPRQGISSFGDDLVPLARTSEPLPHAGALLWLPKTAGRIQKWFSRLGGLFNAMDSRLPPWPLLNATTRPSAIICRATSHHPSGCLWSQHITYVLDPATGHQWALLDALSRPRDATGKDIPAQPSPTISRATQKLQRWGLKLPSRANQSPL